MAKQDVLDAINTTIAPNNIKGITAQSLNNVLTMMTENAGEGGGSGALKVWAEDAEAGMFLTEEQKAENVATYNVLIKGEQVPVILCSKYEMSDEGFSASQTTTHSVSYVALKYSSSGENREDVMFFLGDNMESAFILHSDGTIELIEEPSTPASSGPLYLNEDSSHNQEVYNVVFSALSNMEPCPQILMIDSGICASSITVWLDNNLVQNGVAISVYMPSGYEAFLLAPDGSVTSLPV